MARAAVGQIAVKSPVRRKVRPLVDAVVLVVVENEDRRVGVELSGQLDQVLGEFGKSLQSVAEQVGRRFQGQPSDIRVAARLAQIESGPPPMRDPASSVRPRLRPSSRRISWLAP